MFLKFFQQIFFYQLLFAVALGGICANIINIALSSKVGSGVSSSVQASATAPFLAHDLTYYQKIATDNLFHTGFGNLPAIVNRVVTPPPASNVPLRLVGTVVGVGIESMAVIEELATHHQQMYSLGEALPGGAILRTIEDYQVIIERNGRLERLSMEILNETRNESRPQSVRGHYSQVFDRAFVSAQLADIGNLMTQARVDVDAIGAEKGLRISEVVPSSIFAEAGLQNGDFITKVNGQAVGSIEQAYKLMEGMQNVDTLELDMIRGKERRHHSYKIQ